LTLPEEDKTSPEDTLKFEVLSTPSKPKDSPSYEAMVNVFHNGTQRNTFKVIMATDKYVKKG
jgi:hypothetical protein